MYKRLFSVLFIFTLILSCAVSVSCAGIFSIDAEVQTTAAATVTESESPEYTYPDIDYGGAEICFLNMDACWGMYVTIAPDVITGEILNDTVYERNKSIEEKFNCIIKDAKIVSNNGFDAIVKIGKNTILAGENTYDVMYLPINQITSLLTDGSFCNLYGIPELQLDAAWWDGAYNDSVAIGSNLYFASGDLHLMAYDSSWCIFFNENILNNDGLDMPYDTVRDGKWTIDVLMNYCKAVANLNGDGSFVWDQNGTALYGLATHPSAPDKFVFSAGEKYVCKDNDGIPYFAADNERYYNVIGKLAKLLDKTDGTTIEANWDDFNAGLGGYMYVFSNSRSAFLTAEIKAAQLLRDMKDNFGILPFPKYDENQESYLTALMSDLLVMTIPVTNTKVSDTAAILDALCYESYKQVIPVYFNITVSQKGLRSDDSIEMMEIMRKTRGVDISAVFAWNVQLVESIRAKVFGGDNAVSSDIAKYSTQITTEIGKLLEAFNIQA